MSKFEKIFEDATKNVMVSGPKLNGMRGDIVKKMFQLAKNVEEQMLHDDPERTEDGGGYSKVMADLTKRYDTIENKVRKDTVLSKSDVEYLNDTWNMIILKK